MMSLAGVESAYGTQSLTEDECGDFISSIALMLMFFA